MRFYSQFLGLVLSIFSYNVYAQQTTDEEDYSMYEDYGYAGEAAKTYASPKIKGLSPNRFINVAYDLQSPYAMSFSDIGVYEPDANWTPGGSSTIHSTGGLRVNANIPVVSRNSVIWQMGVNYMATRFNVANPSAHPILQELSERVLHTSGLFTTVFKPLNDKQFLLFQGQVDYSGDYQLGDLQPLNTLRYSAALLWGKTVHDRKQWAIGVARTYKVGALNYVPIVLFNWTSRSEKWGAEILFPARAHGRYTFSKRSLLLFGYELEGNSYRLNELSNGGNSFEIRRGEIRPRIEWNRQLVGFFWLNFQAGVRINYSFDADELSRGTDFYRGFFGDQEFSALSSLGTAAYALVGISFVSP